MDHNQKRKYVKYYFRKCLRIRGVQNAIVFNSLGIPVHSTFDRAETITSIGLFDELLQKVRRAIQLINTDDQFMSIRLRTHKFEIFITKDLDDMYFVIFQNAKGLYKIQCTIFSLKKFKTFFFYYAIKDTHSQLHQRTVSQSEKQTMD